MKLRAALWVPRDAETILQPVGDGFLASHLGLQFPVVGLALCVGCPGDAQAPSGHEVGLQSPVGLGPAEAV